MTTVRGVAELVSFTTYVAAARICALLLGNCRMRAEAPYSLVAHIDVVITWWAVPTSRAGAAEAPDITTMYSFLEATEAAEGPAVHIMDGITDCPDPGRAV